MVNVRASAEEHCLGGNLLTHEYRISFITGAHTQVPYVGFDAIQKVWSGCPGYDECGEGPSLLWQMSHS